MIETKSTQELMTIYKQQQPFPSLQSQIQIIKNKAFVYKLKKVSGLQTCYMWLYHELKVW
jgi:hypothetical protein